MRLVGPEKCESWVIRAFYFPMLLKVIDQKKTKFDLRNACQILQRRGKIIMGKDCNVIHSSLSVYSPVPSVEGEDARMICLAVLVGNTGTGEGYMNSLVILR